MLAAGLGLAGVMLLYRLIVAGPLAWACYSAAPGRRAARYLPPAEG